MDTKAGTAEWLDWEIGTDMYTYTIDTMDKIDNSWEPSAQRTELYALWWPKWEGNLKQEQIYVHFAVQ